MEKLTGNTISQDEIVRLKSMTYKAGVISLRLQKGYESGSEFLVTKEYNEDVTEGEDFDHVVSCLTNLFNSL